ncbi:MAG: hypothetical protein ACOYNZ_19245 [Rhodoferax sp.]
MLAGLVFLASLLLAALLMLALWLLRALWSRLNGRPLSPWTFQIDRQAVWNRFYRAPDQHTAKQRNDADVIDVEAKEKPR